MDLALEGELVSIDLVDAQGGEVVDVGFDNVGDVPNQEHCLEQLGVVFAQGWVVGRFVNGALGHTVNKALNRRVEVVQGHQHVGALGCIAHGSGLECIEQGALAT